MTDLSAKSLEDVRREKFGYLTTVGRNSGKNHTVELWFAIASGKIFLSHEGRYTDWMRNMKRNRRVQIRIGKLTLEADAVLLNDGDSKEMGKISLYEKYYGPAPKATIDDWFELSTIVELTPLKYGS